MPELPKTPTEKPEAQHTTADPDHKATQFDGNPNPEAAESSPLSPRDDTPTFLEKRPFKK